MPGSGSPRGLGARRWGFRPGALKAAGSQLSPIRAWGPPAALGKGSSWLLRIDFKKKTQTHSG
jgi:hypothetical protein